MTTALEQSGYELTDVPERTDGGSRWYLTRSTHGWACDPGDALAGAFFTALGSRRAAMRALEPERVTVRLKTAQKNERGEVVLVERGEVSGVQTLAGERPVRLNKCKLRGGSLLDSLALGESAWRDANDQDVWEALRLTVEVHSLEGAAWRRLNDAVARLVALRAGLELKDDSALPHPSLIG